MAGGPEERDPQVDSASRGIRDPRPRLSLSSGRSWAGHVNRDSCPFHVETQPIQLLPRWSDLSPQLRTDSLHSSVSADPTLRYVFVWNGEGESAGVAGTRPRLKLGMSRHSAVTQLRHMPPQRHTMDGISPVAFKCAPFTKGHSSPIANEDIERSRQQLTGPVRGACHPSKAFLTVCSLTVPASFLVRSPIRMV